MALRPYRNGRCDPCTPSPCLALDSAYWFKIIEAAIMCVTALLIGLLVVRPLSPEDVCEQQRLLRPTALV